MLGFRPVRYRHSRRIRTELLHPQPKVDNFPLTTLRHDHAYEVVFPSKVVPDHGLQATDLFELRRDEALAAEARVHRHDQHEVHAV